jgi:ubiquinone/menaquinone biosynthesis C-methylase UbiE
MYKQVIEANIALHTQLAEHYNSCEPHFRPENIAKVEAIVKNLCLECKVTHLVDLGCGTGFMINIAKKYVKNIIGVDITPAMLNKVDTSGNAEITLIQSDTGNVSLANESAQLVTAYSFLHHLFDIKPTLETAFKVLTLGGSFYADLDPNYYFWEQVNKLDRYGSYDPIVKREIEMVTYKDEDIEKNFGVSKDTFNQAEYGKNIAGGFKEEEIISLLKSVGFSSVKFMYHWYIGQGSLINDAQYSKEERFKYADITNEVLQKIMPLSRHLFKYVGFIASK